MARLTDAIRILSPHERRRRAAHMGHARRPLALAALLLLAACAQITLPRRTLSGVWNVELLRDNASASGTLTLSDSNAGVFHSNLQIDFVPLLGRPMSCFDPRPTTTTVSREGDVTFLGFTPGVADCGFGASGTFFGDSLIGTWSEESFRGPIASGRFRMVRTRL
jgi:hypothetical protein